MKIKVADQGWIALGLLHRENADRSDFRSDEVLARARREFGELLPGVRAHLSSHSVASAKPDPGTHRMITRTERGRLRLFRPGDPVHPDRKGKMSPRPEDIPAKYHPLLEWYSDDYLKRSSTTGPEKDGNPRKLMRFIGKITAFDLDVMRRLISEDCERIEVEEGKGKDVA